MRSRWFRNENLLRELTPRVVATVARRFGDFASAEDAVQEALLAAALKWPEEGVPENPRAWLIQVASRRMKDHVRTELARRQREVKVARREPLDRQVAPAADGDIEEEQDDTLVLLFMCCHPALTRPSATALALRAVAGLTTAEIAHAYLVPEATMAQRISRAKRTIRESGIPFSMPSEAEQAERLNAVLHMLYLIFNEGYFSSIGPAPHRPDLASEAIRLTRALYHRLPADAEVAGLLSLMLLTDARRPARAGRRGELIPLSEQDRTLWDQQAIAEGRALLTKALSRGRIGPYQIQAAIAALHDEAKRFEETDWPQILALYNLLSRVTENPMVELNRAVAAAMVHGPSAGMEILESVKEDRRVARHYRLNAVWAYLLELSGEKEAAIAHYRAAADGTRSLEERRYLAQQVARLLAE